MTRGNEVWMQLDHEQRRLAMDLRSAMANATPLQSCSHDDEMPYCPLCLINCAHLVLNNDVKNIQQRIFLGLEAAYRMDTR